MILDVANPSIPSEGDGVNIMVIILAVVVLLLIIGILLYFIKKGEKSHKKSKLLIVLVISLFIINVKADMGPPVIARHEVMVTNKNGAKCYNSGSKKDIVIPYGTTFMIDTDINNGYLYVQNDDYSCEVKASDISSKTQKFSLDDKSVEKITPVWAIVLSSNGLNMRKGPSVTFSKIMTLPVKSIVKLTHRSGDYWYYAEYNGQAGWITGMDGYFAYDGKEVLVSPDEMKIYSTYDKKSVIGKIPANTEITNYINLVSRGDRAISHYVIYNGTVGYVEQMMYKTEETGKIKLKKEYDVLNELGEPIKKLTPQELEYNMVNEYGSFYFPEKKLVAYINEEAYEYVKKVDKKIKTNGYIGEGVFGEAKTKLEKNEEIEEVKEKEENKDIKESKSISSKDVIIICLLSGIFIALTTLVIIKLVNTKKNKNANFKNMPNDDNKIEE